jgi:methyl-accepting chemotaxis protein
MKRWLQYLRSSFSARLSLWVTGIVAAIYVVSLYLIFQFSLAVKDDSLESIMQDLIEADYNRLLWIAFLVVGVGLFLLLLVCRFLIDRDMKQLDQLADTVRRINDHHTKEGLSQEPMTWKERNDEIGSLQRSFLTMQQTLAGYINEIHQKTDDLKYRQLELKAAYELSQEDQRVKTAFLRNVSQQIALPVSSIQNLISTIAANYQDLSEEELGRIRAEIVSQTNEITLLIDQKLIISQQS